MWPLHVACPARWLQGDSTGYMAVQGSKNKSFRLHVHPKLVQALPITGTRWELQDLTSEAPEHNFCHILLVKSVTRPNQIQGGGEIDSTFWEDTLRSYFTWACGMGNTVASISGKCSLLVLCHLGWCPFVSYLSLFFHWGYINLHIPAFLLFSIETISPIIDTN